MTMESFNFPVELQEEAAERKLFSERVSSRYVKPLRRVAILASAVAFGYLRPVEKVYSEDKSGSTKIEDIQRPDSQAISVTEKIQSLPQGAVQVGETRTESGKDIRLFKTGENLKEYTATDGETFMRFECSSKSFALEFAPELFELPPTTKRTFDAFVKHEKDMLSHGWVELPNHKHGIEVPGSEREEKGNKIHTEIRRVWEEKKDGIDTIVKWEIDDSGKEVSYRTLYKGSPEYDQYLDLANRFADSFVK